MKMFNSMRLRLLAAGILSASVMVGCGSDSDADANTPTVSSGSLTAAQGALVNASCVVTDAAGSELATVLTGTSGTVSLNFETVSSSFPLIVSCSGGKYFDEANPDAADLTTNDQIMRSIVPDLATFNAVGNNLAVTPFTELAVALFKSITPVSDQVVETALKSLTEIADLLAPGLADAGGSIDLLAGPTPVTDADTDLSTGTQADLYAIYLAGLAQIAKDRVPSITPAALMKELSDEITAGTAVSGDVVSNLFTKAQAFATSKSFPTALTQSKPAKGGAAVKPKPTTATGGTGGTGATGATGAGATGG